MKLVAYLLVGALVWPASAAAFTKAEFCDEVGLMTAAAVKGYQDYPKANEEEMKAALHDMVAMHVFDSAMLMALDLEMESILLDAFSCIGCDINMVKISAEGNCLTDKSRPGSYPPPPNDKGRDPVRKKKPPASAPQNKVQF